MKKSSLPKLTESEFQTQVLEAALLLGWRRASFRSVRIQRANGSVYYATPVQADGEGWPDILLIRKKNGIKRLIVAELKVGRNKTTELQERWLESFEEVAETYVWRPENWEMIKKILA